GPGFLVKRRAPVPGYARRFVPVQLEGRGSFPVQGADWTAGVQHEPQRVAGDLGPDGQVPSPQAVDWDTSVSEVAEPATQILLRDLPRQGPALAGLPVAGRPREINADPDRHHAEADDRAREPSHVSPPAAEHAQLRHESPH